MRRLIITSLFSGTLLLTACASGLPKEMPTHLEYKYSKKPGRSQEVEVVKITNGRGVVIRKTGGLYCSFGFKLDQSEQKRFYQHIRKLRPSKIDLEEFEGKSWNADSEILIRWGQGDGSKQIRKFNETGTFVAYESREQFSACIDRFKLLARAQAVNKVRSEACRNVKF